MPTDAYVQFGEDPSYTDEKTGRPFPEIEGDCTDELHFNWCELRDTGFTLNFPHKDKKADDDSSDNAPPPPDKITLKKRVDWASTRLFLRCCQAAQAKINKNKGEDGTIKKVTVEVCKDAGDDEKFPYLAIEYNNVRILDYSIDMSDPEPTESIQFEYDSFRMGYRKTNSETGLPVGNMEWTDQFVTIRKSVDGSSGSQDAPQQSGSAVTAALSAQGASLAGGAGSGGGNGNGAPVPGIA